MNFRATHFRCLQLTGSSIRHFKNTNTFISGIKARGQLWTYMNYGHFKCLCLWSRMRTKPSNYSPRNYTLNILFKNIRLKA